MKATAVADLHAGGRRVFFDIAAERLLADRQIGGGALQVEPGARLAKLGEFSRIKRDSVRKAYQRGDQLEQRRPILKEWSDYVAG
jgi:hypothetical protein